MEGIDQLFTELLQETRRLSLAVEAGEIEEVERVLHSRSQLLTQVSEKGAPHGKEREWFKKLEMLREMDLEIVRSLEARKKKISKDINLSWLHRKKMMKENEMLFKGRQIETQG